MPLSAEEKSRKLAQLVESEGCLTLDSLLGACITDGVSPGICISANCSLTTEVEPDQRHGFCEACGRNTVQSVLVLADLI